MGIKRLVRKAKHSVSTQGLLARRIAKKGAVVTSDGGYFMEGLIPITGKRTKDPKFLQEGSRALYRSGKMLVRDSEALTKEAQVPMDRSFAGFEKSIGRGNIRTAVAMRYASMKQLKKRKKKN